MHLVYQPFFRITLTIYCGGNCTMPNALDDAATSPARISNDGSFAICTPFHLLLCSMFNHYTYLLQDPNLSPTPPFLATSSQTTHSSSL